jgi:hypothetical protein
VKKKTELFDRSRRTPRKSEQDLKELQFNYETIFKLKDISKTIDSRDYPYFDEYKAYGIRCPLQGTLEFPHIKILFLWEW